MVSSMLLNDESGPLIAKNHRWQSPEETIVSPMTLPGQACDPEKEKVRGDKSLKAESARFAGFDSS